MFYCQAVWLCLMEPVYIMLFLKKSHFIFQSPLISQFQICREFGFRKNILKGKSFRSRLSTVAETLLLAQGTEFFSLCPVPFLSQVQPTWWDPRVLFPNITTYLPQSQPQQTYELAMPLYIVLNEIPSPWTLQYLQYVLHCSHRTRVHAFSSHFQIITRMAGWNAWSPCIQEEEIHTYSQSQSHIARKGPVSFHPAHMCLFVPYKKQDKWVNIWCPSKCKHLPANSPSSKIKHI